MANNSEFWELYKHPLWQKRRLEVMQRAGFRCERCDSSETTLNVHHSFYVRGRKPWEYELATLHCLCEKCHDEMHQDKTYLNEAIARIDFGDWDELKGFAYGLIYRNLYRRNKNLDIGLNGMGYELLCGLCGAFGITVDELFEWSGDSDSISLAELGWRADEKASALRQRDGYAQFAFNC